jgi:hypothetical protein
MAMIALAATTSRTFTAVRLRMMRSVTTAGIVTLAFMSRELLVRE